MNRLIEPGMRRSWAPANIGAEAARLAAAMAIRRALRMVKLYSRAPRPATRRKNLAVSLGLSFGAGLGQVGEREVAAVHGVQRLEVAVRVGQELLQRDAVVEIAVGRAHRLGLAEQAVEHRPLIGVELLFVDRVLAGRL